VNFVIQQLGINVLIAFVWLLLNISNTVAGFTIGFVLGAIIIGFYAKLLDQDFYLKRFFQFLKFLLVCLYELYVACFQVLILVLSPKLNLKPGIIRMDVNLPTDFQLVFLASLINLTPGTLTLEVSSNKKTLYIHALHINDAEKIVKGIRKSFEEGIREIWR
jgi:multicomponent Na+:H+ antiporter subunit E